VKASLATVAIALLLLGAGCSSDDGGTDDTGGDDTTPATEAPSADLSSFETVAELNETLTAAGIDCALEYEGLVDEDKEISQCTIDGSQAFVTIWFDEAFVTEIVAPEGAEAPPGVAYGQNWTVELTPPTPATATAIADAAGGATTDA
jgi:hypothetical protein